MAERKVIEFESRVKARDILDLIASLAQAEYSVLTGRYTVRNEWVLYEAGACIIIEQKAKGEANVADNADR